MFSKSYARTQSIEYWSSETYFFLHIRNHIFSDLTLVVQLSNGFCRVLCPNRRITIVIIDYDFDEHVALPNRIHRKSCVSLTSFDTHNNTRTICMRYSPKLPLISSVLEDVEEPPPANNSAGIQKQSDAFYSV